MIGERDEGEVERVEARAVERLRKCGINVEKAKKTIAEKGLPRNFLDIVCGLIMVGGKKYDFYTKQLSIVLSVILDTEISCEMIRKGFIKAGGEEDEVQECAKFSVDNLSTDILFAADIYRSALRWLTWYGWYSWWPLENRRWKVLSDNLVRTINWLEGVTG
jgi:hypothetical protein